MSIRKVLAVTAFLAFTVCAAVCAEVTVVSTSPANGARNVDPGTTQLRVKFSEAVDTGGYSFMSNDLGAPVEAAGKPLFTEGNTVCVLPIKLLPGLTYSIGINSEDHHGFRSAADQNVPVTPYVITFTTVGGDNVPAPASSSEGDTPKVTGVTVVRTYPEQGAKVIDPKLTYIRIRFSLPVNPEAYSFVKSDKGQFPKVTGKPKFEDGNQLCILPVKLVPGTTYAVGINSESLKDFRSLDNPNVSVTPYMLVFSTAKAKPKK